MVSENRQFKIQKVSYTSDKIGDIGFHKADSGFQNGCKVAYPQTLQLSPPSSSGDLVLGMYAVLFSL